MIVNFMIRVMILLLTAVNVAAETYQDEIMIFKCIRKNGSVAFQDMACGNQMKSEIVHFKLPYVANLTANLNDDQNKALQCRCELRMQRMELENRIQVARIMSHAATKNSKNIPNVTVYTAPTPYAATLQ